VQPSSDEFFEKIENELVSKKLLELWGFVKEEFRE